MKHSECVITVKPLIMMMMMMKGPVELSVRTCIDYTTQVMMTRYVLMSPAV